jgi:hypothetical protein
MSNNQNCQPCQQQLPPVDIPLPPVCVGEACPEVITGPCVRYTGPNIPCINVTTGMDFNQILQLLATKICQCCDGQLPTSCLAATNLTATPQ